MKKICPKTNQNYKWIIFALCFFMTFLGAGFCSNGKNIFLAPVTDALDIQRSVFSISYTCCFVSSAIVNLFFGSAVSRFGTKKLIVWGFVSLICSMLINAVASDVYMFFVSGTLLGIGLSWTGTSVVSTIIRKWANKNVGTIMGFILCSSGLGGAVAAQIFTPVIYSGKTAFSYRNAYFLIAVILLVFLIIFLLSYKEADKSRLHEKKEQKDSEPKWEGVDTKTALKSPSFIIMAVYILFFTMSVHGLLESFTARLTDKGISVGFAATVLSVFSVMFAFSKFFTGFLYDKFGIVLTACVCNFSAVFSVLLFVFTENSPFGRVLAILSAIVFAFSVPIETVLLALFANDLFGFRAYNDVLGIFVSVMYAGAGIGPLLLNSSFDIFGNYNTGYLISFIIAVACSILFFIAHAFSKKLRNK